MDVYPPELQDRITCSIAAAAKYRVPANIVLAIAEKEGGTPGQWRPNGNGTHDVGSMQFNTAYLADLARYGITASDVAKIGCYSFDLATWRLRQRLYKDKGDLWTRVANYHSRTPQVNSIYRADLIRKATKWADWLDARFVTFDMLKASAVEPPVTNKMVATPDVELQARKEGVSNGTRLQTAKTEYVARTLITSRRSAEKR